MKLEIKLGKKLPSKTGPNYLSDELQSSRANAKMTS